MYTLYTTAMAYIGTSDNNNIKKLLHISVSDVNDDVRRAAVTCIGKIYIYVAYLCCIV